VISGGGPHPHPLSPPSVALFVVPVSRRSQSSGSDDRDSPENQRHGFGPDCITPSRANTSDSKRSTTGSGTHTSNRSSSGRMD